MEPFDRETLKRFARKYVWWKTPDDAAAIPERVVALVMNIGDYDDVQALAEHVGDDYLRTVLTHAEVGQFNARSWAYWHYRLGLAEPGRVPVMPDSRDFNAGKLPPHRPRPLPRSEAPDLEDRPGRG